MARDSWGWDGLAGRGRVCRAEGLTDFAGVVGIGGTAEAGKTLRMRLDLEDNIYSAQLTFPANPGGAGGPSPSKLQHDLAVVAGLVVPFGGQRP